MNGWMGVCVCVNRWMGGWMGRSFFPWVPLFLYTVDDTCCSSTLSHAAVYCDLP